MNATESRGLEKCALSTLFHFSEIMGQEVPTIDPGLFSDSGFRRLAEVIGEIGAFQLPVMNAVKGEEYASAALFEIMECYTSHSIPLDFLDRMVLSHLRKLTRGRAIELAARESIALVKSNEADDAFAVMKTRVSEPMPGEDNSENWSNGSHGAAKYMELVQRLQSPEGLPERIRTGIRLFDYVLNESIGGGIHEGQVGCIAARPGRGKSTFAVFVIDSILERNPLEKVGLFSLEMTARDVGKKMVDRFISQQPRSESSYLKKISFAVGEADGKNERLLIDDRSGLTVEDLITQADNMKRKGVRLFFVDYIQRVNVGDVNPEALRVAFGEVVEKLTIDAKESGRCWVLLSQFSRSAEGRVPVSSDLKETGVLEENSFWILGLHRPMLKEPNAPERLDPRMLEIHILKNRFGPSGDCLRYNVDWPGVDMVEN